MPQLSQSLLSITHWNRKSKDQNSNKRFALFTWSSFILKSNFPFHRMLRVRNDSCEIHEKFHGAIQVTLKWYKKQNYGFRYPVFSFLFDKLRVKRPIQKKLRSFYQVCYNHYSQEAEDREPFGQGWRRWFSLNN